MNLPQPGSLPTLDWSGWGTRYLFFTGKGGVGKTTTASAVAVALSDEGRRTLIISTDPASNLDDVFGVSAGPEPFAVAGVERLFVANLDPVAADRQAAALAAAPGELATLPTAAVPLIAEDLTGVAALRKLAATVSDAPADLPVGDVDLPGLHELVDELDAAGNGVVMTMGKGGVGNTTLAAALALALADRGHEVTLSTTDPAAHLTHALAHAMHHALLVERIDPALETARYTDEVLTAAGTLEEEGRALLEEDLRSPCTEEIAVFGAFARTVDAAQQRIVVLDTTPTGHTLLLLDAAQSYHREVQRTQAAVPEEVAQLLARLRDPQYARMLLITLAESTPVQEAERLQDDLRRAEIEPYGWVINASLAAADTTHPTLHARASAELTHIEHVQRTTARTWLVAWQPEPPVGPDGLRPLTAGTALSGR